MFEKQESATIKGEEKQDAKDNTNHEDDAVEELVRYPSRTRKPPKHLQDSVVGDDVEAMDTARCLEFQ